MPHSILNTTNSLDHTIKYDLSFKILEDNASDSDGAWHNVYSKTGFTVELRRSPLPFVWNTYMPTFCVTLASFLGFVIPADNVPGRMTLLVTIFLMLINLKSTERNMGPDVSFFQTF